MTLIKVKHLETGRIEWWDINIILYEINRDRGSDWVEYDETDWEEGWKEWCEGITYSMNFYNE